MSHHFGKLIKKNCELCGKEFDTDNKNKRFCSIKCANVYRGKLRRKEDKCKMCGKKHYSKSHNLFCSKDCKHNWKLKQEEIRKNKSKVYKDYNLVCEECGHNFTSHNKRARFCSPHCSSTHNNRHLIKYRKCKYCGEPFHKKSMWGVVFCGPDCRKKWNEEHRKPKSKKVKKEKVLHTLKCRICNKEFKRYIIPKDMLCRDCRYELHKQKQREKYKEEEFKSKSFVCKNCGKKIDTELGNKHSVFCCPECATSYGKKEERKTDAFKKKSKERKEIRKQLIKENFVEEVNYEKVYERDNGICQICELPVHPNAHGTGYWDGTMDHKIPLTLGGEHSMENIQLSHRCCNSFKNQSLGDYKMDWYKKSKENNYFAKRFDEYKEMMKDIA